MSRDDERTRVTFNLTRRERDILETLAYLGELNPGLPGTLAGQVLRDHLRDVWHRNPDVRHLVRLRDQARTRRDTEVTNQRFLEIAARLAHPANGTGQAGD